jgi:hypothetical protein
MSYTHRYRQSLGGVTDVASAVLNVASDPCLGQVAKLLNDLHALEQNGALGHDGIGALGATDPIKGIGLCKAVTPLRMAIAVRKHPYATVGGGAAIVLGLLALGYFLGKEAKRS